MTVYIWNWQLCQSDPDAILRWNIPTDFEEQESALILPYNTLRIPVADLDWDSVHYYLLHCCQHWQGKGPRNDWAWVLD